MGSEGEQDGGGAPVGRRSFVRTAMVAGAGALVSRAAVARAAAAPVPAFELADLTVAELRAGLESGQYTARSLAEQYLARIDSVDRAGPTVNAVIERNPDALAIADALDAERRSGRVRGPLHGIPVLVKDNVDTADRMRTSAGSLALADSVAPRDAFIVERLRAAGVVLLGKTNLSEWANFRSTRSSSGWSGRGGQTRNPYVLDRSPSGSSSGSAVAAAASLARSPLGPRPTGRSSRRRRSAAWWGSSPPWGW
jgi:amidase